MSDRFGMLCIKELKKLHNVMYIFIIKFINFGRFLVMFWMFSCNVYLFFQRWRTMKYVRHVPQKQKSWVLEGLQGEKETFEWYPNHHYVFIQLSPWLTLQLSPWLTLQLLLPPIKLLIISHPPSLMSPCIRHLAVFCL